MSRAYLAISVVLLAACGGKKVEPTTAGDPGDPNTGGAIDGEVHHQPTGGTGAMIAPETSDEIQRRFRRKGDAVSRCLSFAIDNKDLPKNSRGKITLGVTIGRDGKAGNVKVIKASLESKSLTDCVLGKVKEIQFPEVPAAYETTYTYAFEAS